MLATGKITVTPIKELNFTSMLTFDRENGNTFNFLDPHEIQYDVTLMEQDMMKDILQLYLFG